MKQYDVLLTYAWVRSSYAALRSLTRLGLKVAVADTGKLGMGQWSRFSHFCGTYSQPLIYPLRFIEDVNNLLFETGAEFLLPGHDETEVFAKYREQLPQHIHLPVAEYDKIRRANDKSWTSSFAQEIGIPVPATIHWQNFTELERRLSNMRGPVVIKLRRGNSAKGVFYASSKKETLSLCEKLISEYELTPERYPIIQKKISGDGWGVSCLYWHGARIASFTHRRLREKTVTGGTSTLRESQRHIELEAYAHNLLDKMEWHGLAMVEFKYDPESDSGWFIEINPRLWGSIHLAISAGVDFPALLYIAATQGIDAARKLAKPQQEGIIARWYLGDLILAANKLRHFRLKEAFPLLLPGQEDTLDDFHKDDIRAFLGEVAYYLTSAIRYRSTNPVQQGMLG